MMNFHQEIAVYSFDDGGGRSLFYFFLEFFIGLLII